ncbi:hypothetical protein [Lacimicrobium sp. SS2-24]|uniref:hypothetical protein n=1 Tax=Lacimicrobium sp. SS2-24 TaxID=2005569 RepID=UPI000B4B92CF|nr:hypothetical protein [Lacimicrobium sp. SS2-24]
MLLARFAVLKFDSLDEKWESWSFDSTVNNSIYNIAAQYTKRKDNHVNQMVVCSTRLRHKPKVTRNNEVVVPRRDREEMETLIEHAANLLGLANQTPRSISSVTPPAALVYENEDERDWLDSKSGVLVESTVTHCRGENLEMKLLENLDNLSDRMDGVALMSEAYCHSHLCGKFHECFRLFERAFGVSSTKLIDPLFKFFESTSYGYSRKEIADWVQLRHGVTHADVKEDFLMEKDVISFQPRVHQAALDLLMNKTNWRSDDYERREVWKPLVGYDENGIFLTQGEGAKLFISLLDDFGVYPVALEDGILPNLPKNGWYGGWEHKAYFRREMGSLNIKEKDED